MEIFINKLLDLRIFRAFKVRSTPRWIILLLDMLIVMFCYISTVIADMYSLHTVLPLQTILTNAFIILIVYFTITYLSKSYTFVTRLSVIEDLYRIFMVIAISTIVLVGVNVVKLMVTDVTFMKFWDILIIGALSFSIMMIERLCIKYLYMRMNSANAGRKRVLVLGTSFSSVFLANALKGEIGGKYQPVGLLSFKGDRGDRLVGEDSDVKLTFGAEVLLSRNTSSFDGCGANPTAFKSLKTEIAETHHLTAGRVTSYTPSLLFSMKNSFRHSGHCCRPRYIRPD